ncbi:MAG: hypothetical protein SFT91_01640 [Rickettsiaceae bacterium]|nr:hypothetical protein [Rickettsiaceae bacterium]
MSESLATLPFRYLKIGFSIICLILTHFVSANMPSSINSKSHLENVEYDSLSVNGSLDFENLLVKGQITTNGTLQCKKLKCQKFSLKRICKYPRIKGESDPNHG